MIATLPIHDTARMCTFVKTLAQVRSLANGLAASDITEQVGLKALASAVLGSHAHHTGKK